MSVETKQIKDLSTSIEEQLLEAARKGKIHIINQILSTHEVNINCIGAADFTPLIHAVHSGNIDAVECLLAHGANVVFESRPGFNALIVAINKRHINLLSLLLEKRKIEVADLNKALIAACKSGQFEAIKILVKCGASALVTDQLDHSLIMCILSDKKLHCFDRTIGNCAEANQYFDSIKPIIEYLHSHGANINHQAKNGKINLKIAKHGYTALMLACETGNLNVVKFFVDMGANINHVNEEGYTPLLIAAKHSQKLHKEEFESESIIKFLCLHGADVSQIARDGYSALKWVLHNHDDTAFQFLLQWGAPSEFDEKQIEELKKQFMLPANPNNPHENILNRLLHIRNILQFARTGEAFDTLLINGFGEYFHSFRTSDGMLDTPLHIACRNNQPKSLKSMLDALPKALIVPRRYSTLDILNHLNNKYEDLRTTKEKQIPILCAQNKNGFTLLDIAAAQKDNKELCEILANHIQTLIQDVQISLNSIPVIGKAPESGKHLPTAIVEYLHQFLNPANSIFAVTVEGKNQFARIINQARSIGEREYQAGLSFQQAANKKLTDYRNAAICFYRATKRNHIKGMLCLAKCHEKGEGVPKNPGIALRILKKVLTLDPNNKEAKLTLLSLKRGEMTQQDYLRQAAKLDDCNALLEWHNNLIGNQKENNMNGKIALDLVKKAIINTRNSKTILYLADHYLGGIGVNKNITIALKLIEEAADLGEPRALYTFGCYLLGQEDEFKAFLKFRLAADNGHAGAAIKLGLMLTSGSNWVVDIKQDFDEAASQLERAGRLLKENLPINVVDIVPFSIELGQAYFKLAQTYLSVMLEKADKQNYLNWLKQAKDLGHNDALKSYRDAKQKIFTQVIEGAKLKQKRAVDMNATAPKKNTFQTIFTLCPPPLMQALVRPSLEVLPDDFERKATMKNISTLMSLNMKNLTAQSNSANKTTKSTDNPTDNPIDNPSQSSNNAIRGSNKDSNKDSNIGSEDNSNNNSNNGSNSSNGSSGSNNQKPDEKNPNSRGFGSGKQAKQ